MVVSNLLRMIGRPVMIIALFVCTHTFVGSSEKCMGPFPLPSIYYLCRTSLVICYFHRGGFRGGVQGVRTPPFPYEE